MDSFDETVGEKRLPEPRFWSTTPEGNRMAVVLGLLFAVVMIAVILKQDGPAPPSGRRGQLKSIQGNETAAIETLRTIHGAQEQAAATGSFDIDGDGLGGYGFFHELSREGTAPNGRRLDAPLLGDGFTRLLKAYGAAGGTVRRGGYHFQLFLWRSDGTWIPEANQGGRPQLPEGLTFAEDRWLCMAWPDAYCRTGKRAFLIDHCGIVLAANNSQSCYEDGRAAAPGRAGFQGPDALAIDCVALDGQHWRTVR